MTKNKKLLIAKISLAVIAVPFVLRAYEYGPDPFRSAAPGDAAASRGSGNCLDSGCHSGSPLNGGPGSVRIVLAGGNSYVPGVKQRLMVQIMDATKQKFGFELSARIASDNSQAGDFSTTDSLTAVVCGSVSQFITKNNGASCPSASPLQFIEHTLAGYSASTAGSYTYQFDWTPPATNVGNVMLYVAANAGPGGAPVQSGANVYTTSITLTPSAAPAPPAPTISSGGVVPVYSSSTTIQPGSWFSIYGSNLASATTVWNGDFPTSLGGTTVTINGKNAYLWFVSSSQINAQAPDDTATGSVPVTVTTAGGTANTTVTLGQAGPSFLLLGDAKHATGIIITPSGGGSQGGGSYDLLGPAASGPGFRAAKKGEPIALYAVGLGPLNVAVASGRIYTCPAGGCAPLAINPTVTLGGVPVTIDFAGVVGAGLYQINFTVPANVATGDQTLVATVNGLQTQANVTIPIQ